LSKRKIALQKGSLFDTLMVESRTSKSNKFLMNDFTQVQEVDKITFGNKYQYNATSGNEILSPGGRGLLDFPGKSAEVKDYDLKSLIKHRKHSDSSRSPLTSTPNTERPKPDLANKPFHRSVNSLDIKSSTDVKTKQIMFYADLVGCNDLNKLFNVIDKTPSFTSLSI